MKRSIFYILLLLYVGVGCTHHSVPKPYGYFRIDTPDTAYVPIEGYPYRFDLSANAVVRAHEKEDEKYWIDICYPTLNATVHCSYKPVKGNLRELTDDAVEFVYKHAQQASAIPEQAFENPEARVYGVLYNLEGNTASPCQFFVTDSTHHFFRGALYCNSRPNADSLAPVYDYVRQDIVRLIESFEWK